MQTAKIGLLLAMVVGWTTAQVPGPPPPRGLDQDPGAQRPARPGLDHDGDPGEPPPPPPPPPPFGPPPNPLFLAIDTDNDGELSSKEIARASQTILKLDRNKDGVLTEDEVRPPPPPGQRPARREDSRAFIDSILRFDKNADGKVTAQELPERMARLLEEADANKDGALERSEIETLARRPPPRRSGGGPPPPRPGPGGF